MTKFELSYNPFYCKSEMKINNQLITKTSSLYKYKNTNIQDWIGIFLDKLRDDCNDEEILIKFKGLDSNYKELEEQVEIYMKKNSNIRIKLEEKISRSQKNRIEEFNEIIKENFDFVKNNIGQYLELENEIDFFKLELFIVSSDENKSNELLKSNKINLVEYKVKNLNNKCYLEIENAILNLENPIIIFIIDASLSRNDKLNDVINTNLNTKGKINRDRFIFLANDLNLVNEYRSNILETENLNIYGYKDFYKMNLHLKKYIEDYYLNKKIFNIIQKHQEKLKNGVAQIIKEKEKIKKMYYLESEHIQKVEMQVRRLKFENYLNNDTEKIKNYLNNFIGILKQNFKLNIYKEKINKYIVSEEGIIEEHLGNIGFIKINIKQFIEDYLKIAIKQFLKDKIKLICEESESQINLSDIEEICVSGIYLNKIIIAKEKSAFDKDKEFILSDLINEVQNQINSIQIEVEINSDERNRIFFNKKTSYSKKFNFYEGILKLIENRLISNPQIIFGSYTRVNDMKEYLNSPEIQESIQIFNNKIEIVKPILEEELLIAVNKINQMYNKIMGKIKCEIMEELKFELDKLRNCTEEKIKNLDNVEVEINILKKKLSEIIEL